MPTFPRRRAPFWFHVCVALAGALALRVFLQGYSVADATVLEPGRPLIAFWPFLIIVAEAIWKGLQVAAHVTLEILHWLYLQLSYAVGQLIKGLAFVGHQLLAGLKRGWDFTRKLYDDVLKPAWKKFWGWFDKVKSWMDRTFAPVLRWLRRVRDVFLKFYKTFVRPWLDLIDVTRKALRVLVALHLGWARALDERLGKLQTLIEKPFRIVLAKINEVINLVNRIVTFDGLLQRGALIRSLARDYEYAWRAIVEPYKKPVSEAQRQLALEKLAAAMMAAGIPPGIAVAIIAMGVVAKPQPTLLSEFKNYFRDRGGRHAPLLDEMTLVWRKQLRAR